MALLLLLFKDLTYHPEIQQGHAYTMKPESVSICRPTSNIRRTKSLQLNVSRLVLQFFVQSIEARCLVENEGVVGAAPTHLSDQQFYCLLRCGLY